VIAALGFVILGFSQNLAMLILGAAVIGIAEGFCTTAAASRMVTTWFHSHQGLILGLVTASTGLGGSLFSVILSRVIEASGWRASYWLSGLLVAAVGLLLLLCVRNRPADLGLRPFGESIDHGKKPKKETRDHWSGYEVREVYRKPTFYLMILVVFLSCCCSYVAFSVVSPHLQDCGMTAQQAATVQSVMLLALAASKFICGALSDVLGAKVINLMCMICTVLGLLLFAEVGGMPMAIAAAVVYSVALVLTTITVPLLSSSLFGYHPQGAIIGIFMALVPAASVITNPVINMLYDRIGSYRPIFRGGAIASLAVTGMMLLLFVLAAIDRKKYEKKHPNMPSLEDVL
jgi:sugar phosphate permease